MVDIALIKTEIPNVYVVEPGVYKDNRGAVIKIFQAHIFSQLGLDARVEESYYSISEKNVIRGMHFQIPPFSHAKLVYVTSGRIKDVILDIRKGSPSYGKFIVTEISEANHKAVFIPIGCAHGFLSLDDETSVTYLQSSIRSADHEAGIRTDSFGMKWGVANPIISTRDLQFPALAEYSTPFRYIKSKSL